MDTIIHIKGYLMVPEFDDKSKTWLAYKSNKFVLRNHENQGQVELAAERAIAEIVQMQGMSVVADTTKQSTKDNLQFWPMHNFRFFQPEYVRMTHPITDMGETIN